MLKLISTTQTLPATNPAIMPEFASDSQREDRFRAPRKATKAAIANKTMVAIPPNQTRIATEDLSPG